MLDEFNQPPASTFADPVADADSQSSKRSTALWVLTALLLLCLLPRAVMALRLGSVCDDAYYYIYTADALEKGNYTDGLSYLNVNVYPVILAGLHRLGIDWVVAGKLWGVLISTLLVLPLFGWVRRHFDERVAIVSCFLYAVHPELIELSVEPIRETTFWFFVTLFLYLATRAVTETRWWQFAAAGLTMALAIHTRTEGWILAGVILIWAVQRSFVLIGRRRQLAFGTVSCLAMIPLTLIAFNVTFLRQHSEWEWGRLAHFQTGYHWIASMGSLSGDAGPPSINESAAVDSAKSELHAAVSTKEYAHTYVDDLINALEPFNALLLLLGVVIWRHLLWQPGKSVLLFAPMAVLLAVWIRLVEYGDINGRYFLTIFFFSVPSVALGLLMLTHWARKGLRRLSPEFSASIAVPAGMALLLTVAFSTDALSSYHTSRMSQAKFGRWLQANFGPFQTVVVDTDSLRIGYVALGDVPAVRTREKTIEDIVRQSGAELVIFATRQEEPGNAASIIARLEKLNFQTFDGAEKPSSCKDFNVLTKTRPARVSGRVPSDASDLSVSR